MGARDFYQDFFPKVAFFKRNDSKKWPFCCQKGICCLYLCKFNRGFAWNFLVVASVVEFLNSQLLLPSSQELAATAEDVLTGRTTASNIFRDFPGKTTEAL